MEGLNGVGVYHVLHGDPLTTDIPIVFITGYTTTLKKLMPRYQERNITILEKPLNPDHVIEVIQSLLATQPRRYSG